MKENTKKLLESPILEDFLIGLNFLYAQEGIKYFRDQDLGERHSPGKFMLPEGFVLHPKIVRNFQIKNIIIVEDLNILIHDNRWKICTICYRLANTGFTRDQIEHQVIHEINPIYPWTG